MSSENLEQNMQDGIKTTEAGAPLSDEVLSEDYSILTQQNSYNLNPIKGDYDYTSHFIGKCALGSDAKPEQVGYENDVFTGKIKIIRTPKLVYDQVKERGIILTYINNLPNYWY